MTGIRAVTGSGSSEGVVRADDPNWPKGLPVSPLEDMLHPSPEITDALFQPPSSGWRRWAPCFASPYQDWTRSEAVLFGRNLIYVSRVMFHAAIPHHKAGFCSQNDLLNLGLCRSSG
jgi:hypothetical protein